MLSPLRNRFGIPGVISVVALVFAMLGGAYAANNSSDDGATASAKAKRGPKGPKGATGPAGPVGPPGPAGAQGPKGDNGSNGSNGATGAAGSNGQSVTMSTEPPGDNCPVEGVKLTSASATNYVCNGADGADGTDGAPGPQGPAGKPWMPDGTLPTGATMSGFWSFSADKSDETPTSSQEFAVTPISFGIPLATALDSAHAIYVKTGSEPNPHCNGDANYPKASSGYLCVYEGIKPSGNLSLVEVNVDLGSQNGAMLVFSPPSSDGAIALGTWAVTG